MLFQSEVINYESDLITSAVFFQSEAIIHESQMTAIESIKSPMLLIERVIALEHI